MEGSQNFESNEGEISIVGKGKMLKKRKGDKLEAVSKCLVESWSDYLWEKDKMFSEPSMWKEIKNNGKMLWEILERE